MFVFRSSKLKTLYDKFIYLHCEKRMGDLQIIHWISVLTNYESLEVHFNRLNQLQPSLEAAKYFEYFRCDQLNVCNWQ